MLMCILLTPCVFCLVVNSRARRIPVNKTAPEDLQFKAFLSSFRLDLFTQLPVLLCLNNLDVLIVLPQK